MVHAGHPVDRDPAAIAAEVCIAVDEVYPYQCLTRALHALSRDYPNTRVQLMETVLSGGAEKLLDGEVDLLIAGRVTVPVLWDTRSDSIVNNESAEIIRMLNSAFNALTGNGDDYYPAALQPQIDDWNARIYPAINNGAYRAGFATTQEAYEEAYLALFAELDRVEQQLGRSRFLTGEQMTEADIRLFTTLIRFDAVYHGHFKCNRQLLEEYVNLPGYIRDIYQSPGVAATVNFDHIKTHYYHSHRGINPTGIVPLGPDTDYSSPHGRG